MRPPFAVLARTWTTRPVPAEASWYAGLAFPVSGRRDHPLGVRAGAPLGGTLGPILSRKDRPMATKQEKRLAEYARTRIRNTRGEVVGELLPAGA